MSNEDHKEDAANYVAGGMRCGKTLVMENAKLKESLELAENDCKVTAGISAERLEKMNALKKELSEMAVAAAEEEVAAADDLVERNQLSATVSMQEALIKRFCEAALA
ncbi:unnamed protein product, partial [marine sediment metagenome]